MKIKKIAFIGFVVSIFFGLNSLAKESIDQHKWYVKMYGPEVLFKKGAEPEGFRGVKWGQNVTTISGLKVIDKPDQVTSICIRPSDKMKIGRINLHKIRYKFWMEKFWRVEIVIKRSDTPSVTRVEDELRQILRNKFGGITSPGNLYLASSEKVKVSLFSPNMISRIQGIPINSPPNDNYLVLIIFNREISKQMDQYYIDQGRDDF
jgi:hypothetical protein